MTPTTPEQVAAAISVARRAVATPSPSLVARALLAEHERAERMAAAVTREAIARTNAALNAQDAARWRAVRGLFEVEWSKVTKTWWLAAREDIAFDPPEPATVDEAADRLIAEQESEGI